ncbi:MAG: hypothetical protein M1814_001578 [Vezdaea aestivalis]|nr:MAG: hypothetical protein M1814_001578 [Vezdaea aestivalis]
MPQAGPPAEESRGSSSLLRVVLQAASIFFVVQLLANQFLGSTKTSSTSSVVPEFDAHGSRIKSGNPYSEIPEQIAPIWAPDTALDISIYVSSSLAMPSLRMIPTEALVMEERNVKIGDWKDKRKVDTIITLPKDVQNNGTLWAHFYVGKSGSRLDPLDKSYDSAKAYHFTRALNQYITKKKVKKTKKLLSSSESGLESEELVPSGPIIASYYHPNFTVSLIPDAGIMPYTQLHPAVRQFVNLESTGARDKSGQHTWYYPILFVNTFWQLRDHMIELNSTVKEVPLHIDLNNMKDWKFKIYASVDHNVKTSAQNAARGATSAGGDGSEFEEFKRILMDTNSYLLATTGIVTVLHMVFEMLAFKNDVSHFRNKKDNVGVSVRTILANVIMQAIIFLYLVDNSDGTSWMILFGQGMGIVIEAWKVTKTVDVRVRPAPANSWLPYRVTFEDKHKLSETEKKTQEYDEIAFRYLYMVAVPLLGAYAIYSLIYESHKSWYSFIITTLVGSVYAYGFLMMVPSLYINFRLKSVAHMPARAMTYKFLNTFIDDLFAFTIKMPTLHRLATLRDDVIFFIYLYQSYKYKVDYTRVNEFGQGGDDDDETKKVEPPIVEAKLEKRSTASGRETAQGATKRR